MIQRWRYADSNGRAIWLAFDPNFLCIYCDRPVRDLSMGGPALCPACDCGYSDGKRWDMDTFARLTANARRRINDLPDDPAWAQYEAAFAASA